MSGNSELESLIHIHLTMVRQPSKRAFAGTGQSRRREKTSAHWIAHAIVAGVRVNIDSDEMASASTTPR